MKLRTRSILLALLTCLILLVLGCGYALVGRASNIPEDVRSVYLAPFENRTQRAEVEQFLTQSLADELVTRQRFSIVSNESESDAVLRGTVVSFNVTPLTFDNEGRASEYEISIVANVNFQRFDSEDVLWSNERYLFKENYEVESSAAGFFDRENLAIEDSSKRFAETMVTDLLEGF